MANYVCMYVSCLHELRDLHFNIGSELQIFENLLYATGQNFDKILKKLKKIRLMYASAECMISEKISLNAAVNSSLLIP